MSVGADRDLRLADAWQRNFPLEQRPFARVGASLGMSENEALDALTNLSKRGILSRVGPVIRPNTVGASTLAAMAVPPADLERVADRVSAEPGVNHNYEREHRINLWFVVTASDKAAVAEVLSRIAETTGYPVLDLRLERSYHIDLGFAVTARAEKVRSRDAQPGADRVDDEDRAILAQLCEGLPLAQRPFELVAMHMGLTERQLLGRIASLIERGVISRFGCILKHRALGYQANAMVVWDVPDGAVDDVGERLARRQEVTLCYRRTRRPPQWPYNLFVMIHGRQRETVLNQIEMLNREENLSDLPSAVLFSRRCFKQRGAKYEGAAVAEVK
ncbi:MAG: Lrp/AsnC family transcriptional regulator [Rhodovibrionaceae bacterium]|nr:Lrp/AsnC family transcriptional regulator [Rhodovibrionaceae bacterium]